MNKENILATADALEKFDGVFDMTSVETCIVGFVYEHMKYVDVGCQQFFGIKEDAYREMIMPSCWSIPDLYPKEEAVAMLRNLAETGEVKWA